MALHSREQSFLLMLATSMISAVVIRLIGPFRYKKEVLSIVGLTQMIWFCGPDTVHLLVMMMVGTTLTKSSFGPRMVFVYCFLHRVFFSMSKYIGLPRDESNLANATMFISTLKMVIVAYEVSDFRKSKENNQDKDFRKPKWINLEVEPSGYDILCYMTCFAAVLTGPVFRYKTYHDMLYKYLNVSIKKDLVSRFLTCGVIYAIFVVTPINAGMFKNGFYDQTFPVRYALMIIIVLMQVIKYGVAWLLAECVCILIGLGAYPISSNPKVGMGPSVEVEKENPENFNFKTISTVQIVEVFKINTVRGTLLTWNTCTQWWLAYFIYSSTVLPRNWRILRAIFVLVISAAWHGVKFGYFASFPFLALGLFGEMLFLREVERFTPASKFLSNLYYMLFWTFYKMGVICYLFGIFVLQDYEKIILFMKSMYFYGNVAPVLLVIAALVIKIVFPKPKQSPD